MFIDTHTHLYSSQFDEDRDEMVQRALYAGVSKLLLPNIDLESLKGMYELEKKYPKNCFSMLGLHPCSVNETFEQNLKVLQNELEKRKFIAIGEIGIDLYWDKSFLEQQKIAFSTQIQWSIDYNIPFVIHARDSFNEIFEVLETFDKNKLNGIFHCFTGTLEEIQKIRTLGNFYFGIGGVLTFKKSGLEKVVKHLDLSEILLETDSPYLAPTPYRGKRNESSFIPLIADKLSDIFQISTEKIGQITTENAKKCFSLS